MAVGFKIDNETLAITVLVSAGLLYYFTRDMETIQEQKDRRNQDRKEIAEVNLNTLEHRYDDLNLQDVDPEKPLIKLLESQLTQICEDTLRLQSNSMDIEGVNDDFFEHTAYLIRSCRTRLEEDAQVRADRDAQRDQAKLTCPTQNIAVRNETSVVHNHFNDMRQVFQHQINNVLNDARKILQQQQTIDQSGQHFQQQNTEMRVLQLRNPHCETRNADMLPVGGHSAQGLLTHHTCEGTSNASVLDQQQQAKDNQVVKNAVATCVPGPWVTNKPTAAQVLNTTDAMSDLSSAKSRHSAELRDRIGAQIGAPVKRGSVHEVDIFNSAPSIPKDNHDQAPGQNPVPETGAEESITKPLKQLSANEKGMFNQGVKRDRSKTPPGLAPPMAKKPKIPDSPSAVREKAARIEIGHLSARILQELDKLRGATMYHRAAVKGIETMIYGLDKAMHVGGTRGQKEMYKSTLRVSHVDRINKHKRRFSINVVDIKSRY